MPNAECKPVDRGGVRPGKVIVIFEAASDDQADATWIKALKAAFAKTWVNPEDAAYDHL